MESDTLLDFPHVMLSIIASRQPSLSALFEPVLSISWLGGRLSPDLGDLARRNRQVTLAQSEGEAVNLGQ